MKPPAPKTGLDGYQSFDIIPGMVDLDEQLRQAVRRSGLNRKQVADRGGMSYSLIHGFMSGERSMTLRVASRVADVVGLELRPTKRKRKQVRQ